MKDLCSRKERVAYTKQQKLRWKKINLLQELSPRERSPSLLGSPCIIEECQMHAYKIKAIVLLQIKELRLRTFSPCVLP